MTASTSTHRTNRRFPHNTRHVIVGAGVLVVASPIEIPSALGQCQRPVGEVSLNIPSALVLNSVDSAGRSRNFAESKAFSSRVFGRMALEADASQAFAFHRPWLSRAPERVDARFVDIKAMHGRTRTSGAEAIFVSKLCLLFNGDCLATVLNRHGLVR